MSTTGFPWSAAKDDLYLQQYQLHSLVDTERTNVLIATLREQNFVVLLRVSNHSWGADSHDMAAQQRDIQIF